MLDVGEASKLKRHDVVVANFNCVAVHDLDSVSHFGMMAVGDDGGEVVHIVQDVCGQIINMKCAMTIEEIKHLLIDFVGRESL